MRWKRDPAKGSELVAFSPKSFEFHSELLVDARDNRLNWGDYAKAPRRFRAARTCRSRPSPDAGLRSAVFLGGALDGGGPGAPPGSRWFTDFDTAACDQSLSGESI